MGVNNIGFFINDNAFEAELKVKGRTVNVVKKVKSSNQAKSAIISVT